MTRRLLTATAAATLVLGLAACGDKTDGTITDPPATVAVDTSDNGGDQPSDGGGAGAGASDGGGNTEAAPDIPAPDPADYPGMDEETDEGAEQAFKYYFDMAFWGYQTGNTDIIEGMTSPDCRSCNQLIDEIQTLDSKGVYWSETSTESRVLRSEHIDGFDYKIDYGLTLSAHSEPDINAGGSSEKPRSIVGISGGVTWSNGGWKIGDMAIRTEEE